jgi:hypothetical protein
VATKITDITHPEYDATIDQWTMYRLVGEGGEAFLDEYLLQRPQEQNFQVRKDLTYIPAFAKSAIRRVANSIRQRLTAVSRVGGSPKYLKATEGLLTGVNRSRKSMNAFIGGEVLPELLMMGGVGVYVDAPRKETKTLQDDANTSPYMYKYKIENIRAWTRDPQNPARFTKLLLRDYVEVADNEFGLATDLVERFRFYNIDENGKVTVSFYNDKGEQIDPFTNELSSELFDLNIPVIPFVFFQLSDSLLSDIARYQITLLNLGSADVKYAWEGNTVFLAEQYDPASPENYFKHSVENQSLSGGDDYTFIDRTPEKRYIGINKGVRVPKDIEYPKYISPDSAPLEASMKKQAQMKQEIDDILNQNLKSLSARSTTSTEAKQIDQRSEEDGLKAIGDELEYGEQLLAEYWSLYEGTSVVTQIKYPDNYQFKNDADRRTEANELSKIAERTPSITAKKEIGKLILRTLLSGYVDDGVLDTMDSEIDSAVGYISDPETITQLIEAGAVSTETAVVLLGFPPEEAAKAEASRIKRAAAIAQAQASASGPAGVAELSTNPREDNKSAKDLARLKGKKVN